MPDLVSEANWRLMSSSLLFLGPFKMTSSLRKNALGALAISFVALKLNVIKKRKKPQYITNKKLLQINDKNHQFVTVIFKLNY